MKDNRRVHWKSGRLVGGLLLRSPCTIRDPLGMAEVSRIKHEATERAQGARGRVLPRCVTFRLLASITLVIGATGGDGS
jgi:hypothetical protein